MQMAGCIIVLVMMMLFKATFFIDVTSGLLRRKRLIEWFKS